MLITRATSKQMTAQHSATGQHAGSATNLNCGDLSTMLHLHLLPFLTRRAVMSACRICQHSTCHSVSQHQSCILNENSSVTDYLTTLTCRGRARDRHTNVGKVSLLADSQVYAAQGCCAHQSRIEAPYRAPSASCTCRSLLDL